MRLLTSNVTPGLEFSTPARHTSVTRLRLTQWHLTPFFNNAE